MEDARVEASLVWENMTAEERAVYDNMAKDHRERGRGSLYNKFTSDGRPIALVLKEEQDRKQMVEDLVNQVHSYVEERGSLNDIKRSNFYLISFNILCEANGVYFPLELGLVEYSIEQGCTNTFHQFIDSGPIPLGFASLAKDHSDDTHGIPITGFKEGSRDYQGIVKEMLSFLRLSPDDQSLPPFFCAPDHMAQAEGCLRWLEERSCIPIDFPVWNVQTLLLKLRSVAGEPISNAEAQDILNCAVFDYEVKSLKHEATNCRRRRSWAKEVPAGSELREALGDVPFDEYVDVDKHVEVSGPLWDVEIIKVVRPGVVVQGSDDDSDDEELSPPSSPALSAADAETALGVVKRFFSGEENAEDALRCIRNLQC
ncbi:hypothetical protein HPB47_003445 [Ixodes persulcatus]|uniref:Uncharacterized protein n=1 Tax=Ixodes persulcatus TaxID=34615 RepID=A0AC60PJH9_IXOPE|nr:hypothetical protein HPB47_003445 [Ixodes persulcatus]